MEPLCEFVILYVYLVDEGQKVQGSSGDFAAMGGVLEEIEEHFEYLFSGEE
jgi:hypothetical protein